MAKATIRDCHLIAHTSFESLSIRSVPEVTPSREFIRNHGTGDPPTVGLRRGIYYLFLWYHLDISSLLLPALRPALERMGRQLRDFNPRTCSRVWYISSDMANPL